MQTRTTSETIAFRLRAGRNEYTRGIQRSHERKPFVDINMSLPAASVYFSTPEAVPGVELVSVVYPERTFPPHSHPEYVIGAIVAGAEALEVGGHTYILTAGTSLLLLPEQTHANASIPPCALSYRVLYVRPETMAEWLQHRPYFPKPVIDSPALFEKILTAHRALERGSDRLGQQSAFAALIEEVGRCAAPDANPRVRSCSIGIAKAKSYIDASFASDFGLGDLSATAGLSRFHLIRAFKRSIGLTPVAYRNQRRIEAARSLLRSDRTIAEIALEVGFADQSHLTRQFQRLVGTSPARYREQ